MNGPLRRISFSNWRAWLVDHSPMSVFRGLRWDILLLVFTVVFYCISEHVATVVILSLPTMASFMRTGSNKVFNIFDLRPFCLSAVASYIQKALWHRYYCSSKSKDEFTLIYCHDELSGGYGRSARAVRGGRFSIHPPVCAWESL